MYELLNEILKEAYDTTDTGMPFYNTFLNKGQVGGEESGAAYMEIAKGHKSQIIEMIPKEYIEATIQGFKETSEQEGMTYEETCDSLRNTDNYAGIYEKMKSGIKFDMPVLEYQVRNDKVYFTQEGRNRALASEELGEQTIPVLVVFPADPQDRLMAAKAIHHAVSIKLKEF